MAAKKSPPVAPPRLLAPHVRAALQTVQPKAAPRVAGPAAHVAAAVQACLRPGPAAGGHRLAPHVQAAVQAKIAPARPHPSVPPVLQKAPGARRPSVIQRMEAMGVGEEHLQELLETMILPNYQKVEWNEKIKFKVQAALLLLAQRTGEYNSVVDDPVIVKLVKRAAYGVNSKEEEVVDQEGLLAAFQVTDDHLGKFDRAGVNKSTDANVVNVQLKIDQVVALVVEGEESTLLKDETIDSEMNRPDSSIDTVVINTQNDGEVSKLAEKLKIIARFFKNCSGTQNVSFTVGLYGAWGACDGCKKRIERFVELWFAEAKKVMKPGKTATLKVTYQYLNKAKVIVQKYGPNLYGWEDDRGKGPWFHTLEASVTGT